MIKTLKTVLLAAVAFGAVQALGHDVVTKEGTGQAAVVNKNVEKAFKEAEDAAKRSAVEQAAGVYLEADTATKNNQLVMDRVMTNTAGFLKSYEVLTKKQDKDTVTVTVKAQVVTTQLQKDLKAVQMLVKRLVRSKLLIVLNEQSIDEKGISGKSELLSTALTEQFRKDGFNIVDEKTSGERNGALKVAAGVSGGGQPSAKEVAAGTGADFVVYGTASFRHQPPGTGGLITEKDDKGNQTVFFVTGEYDLTMFEVQTGRQLAKVADKFDPVALQRIGGVTKALKNYTQTSVEFCKADSPRIVNDLRTGVIEYLRNQDANGAAVVVKVSGLKSFGEVAEFEKAVSTIKDVKNVASNGDFDNGTQEYEVKFQGNAQELGSALETATFKKKKIAVKTVKNNHVEVAIAK